MTRDWPHDPMHPERGVPDPELWEAPHRLNPHELATDWGLTGALVDEEETR